MKKLKKYKTSRAGLGLFALGDVVTIILYLCCLSVPRTVSNESVLEIVTNVLVILVSVLSTSLISVPLIEVRSKNTLCHQMLTDDVLCTSQFFNALTEEQKRAMLSNLESSVYFDSDPVKEKMYTSIRKKMRGQSSKQDYYLTSCEYSVRCAVEGELIRKTILKKISIQSYKKLQLSDFTLCVTSFPEIKDQDYLKVSLLKVNGCERDVIDDIRSEKTKDTDPLSQKSGYTATMKHTYTRKLSLSPSKPTVIEVEYTTVVPKSDTSYICRVSNPCQKFKFSFFMDGENKNQYRIALNAFGFIDDGNSAPNHHDDTPSASVELNDWMFPNDGVAVTILEKSKVPAAVQ